MALMDYVRILVRRGWIMILVAAIAAGSAYLLTREQTPVYRSTQIVVLQPSRADLGLSESIIRIMQSYALILRSSLIAEQVIDSLQLDTVPTNLQSRVTVDANTLDLSIQIDVEDMQEQQANQIAAAYGQILIDYQNERNQRARQEDRIEVVPQDTPRASIVRPRPTVNAAAGGVIGMLVGGIIVFTLEVLESGLIRRRSDLESTLALPVIAAIPADR
jgi:capsular polysaccharide biosynthesis protein